MKDIGYRNRYARYNKEVIICNSAHADLVNKYSNFTEYERKIARFVDINHLLVQVL